MATEDRDCTAPPPDRQDGDALIDGHSWSDVYYLLQHAQIYTIQDRSGTPTTTLPSEQLEDAGLEPGDPIVMVPRQDESETLFEVVAPPEDVDLSRPPQAFQALLGGGGNEAVGAQSD
jgi:hypothetical protein